MNFFLFFFFNKRKDEDSRYLRYRAATVLQLATELGCSRGLLKAEPVAGGGWLEED